MDRLTESVVTIAVAIIGLATLAVLVSRNANTAGVIGAAGRAFSGSLGVAISPVAGGSSMPSFGSPNGGMF
jgi:hypothetical protein